MALIKVKDVKEAIALMMNILEKLDEIYHALKAANIFTMAAKEDTVMVKHEVSFIRSHVYSIGQWIQSVRT